MFIIGNFIEAVAIVVHYILNLFMWIVIARAVLSWVSPDPFNPIVRFIHNVTEPVLSRIRSTIPAIAGGIDFSPVIVFLAVVFLDKFIVGNLLGISRRFFME